MRSPAEIRQTTSTTDIRFRSKPNKMAKASIKMTEDVLAIVYRETVMNSKLQFENPMSSEEATPVSAVLFNDKDQAIGCLLASDHSR